MKRKYLALFVMALFLAFVSCDKDNNGTEVGTDNTKGSITVYNKCSGSDYVGNIQRILISNDKFFQTYYYDIKKNESRSFSDIPEGTYSVEAQVKTTSLYRNVAVNNVKVNKGKTTSVTIK